MRRVPSPIVCPLAKILLLASRASAEKEETITLAESTDLVCIGGADSRWTTGPLKSNVGTGIRSGNPDSTSECVLTKPTTVPIERVTFDYGWIVGFDSGGPTTQPSEDPVLSIWVQDTPDTGAAGGVQIYSKPLKCDYGKSLHCYSTCDKKNKRDCYFPAATVDVSCNGCTGRYISIKFSNNKRNMQLVMPIDIEINHVWAAPVSIAIDIAGLLIVACMFVARAPVCAAVSDHER
jgi:hypothetical protein